jgi:hypothetical protein
MKLFDTLYYAIYRLGRSIGQPEMQAKSCAVIFMPTFFVLTVFFLSFTLIYKWDSSILPHKGIKPYLVGIGVVVFIVSHIIYHKKGRGQRIISEYGKSKNQKFYVWLGAIFSIVTISLPIWMWLLWRAIM